MSLPYTPQQSQQILLAAMANALTGNGSNNNGGGIQVGGSVALVSPTITVNLSAYTAGDCVGGKLTLTNAMRISGGSGYFVGVEITDASNQKPGLSILIFNSDPTNATTTDHAAFAFGTDTTKLVATLVVVTGDYTSLGSSAVGVADVSCLSAVSASGSANLFAVLVATGTPDFVASTDLKITFKFDQN